MREKGAVCEDVLSLYVRALGMEIEAYQATIEELLVSAVYVARMTRLRR